MGLPRKARNDKKMTVKSRHGPARWPHSDGASSVVCGATLAATPDVRREAVMKPAARPKRRLPVPQGEVGRRDAA